MRRAAKSHYEGDIDKRLDIAHVLLQLTVSLTVKMRMLAFYSVTVSNAFCSVSVKIKQHTNVCS